MRFVCVQRRRDDSMADSQGDSMLAKDLQITPDHSEAEDDEGKNFNTFTSGNIRHQFICTYHTLENNFEIRPKFAKYLKERCR